MQVRQLIDDVVKDAMRAKPDAPAANANASYEVEDVSTPSLENSNAGIVFYFKFLFFLNFIKYFKPLFPFNYSLNNLLLVKLNFKC